MGTDRRWRGYAPDAAVAVGTGLLVLAGARTAPPNGTDLDGPGYGLLLAGALVLGLRRRAPVPVLLACTATMLGYHAGHYPGLGPAVPAMVAVYTAVRVGHRTLAAVCGSALILGVLAANVVQAAGRPGPAVVERWVLFAGWLIAAGILAEVSRHRAAYLDQVEQRAIEAERTRDEAVRRQAGEERLRIARELHDSLTHSISVIKVHAGVAVHLARKNGAEVPSALLAIQEASADAMRELRSTLDVLRRDGGPGDDGPGLDRLPELVGRARAAGLPATVTVTGADRVLPTGVDRAVYRIVQEALTNVARHAGPAPTCVRIQYGEGTVSVRVDDDGPGAAGGFQPGTGLRGMRERVSALGGRLQAGPRPNGGFTVHADLPVPG